MSVKLESLNGLVVTIMEVLCICTDIPICGFSNGCVCILLVVSNFCYVAVLLSFFYCTLRPCSRSEIICYWTFGVTKEIERNCTELKWCTTLEEEDGKVIWDFEQSLQVSLGLLCNWDEWFSSVTHFHNTDACAMPVQQFSLCCLKHFLREDAWTSWKVIDLLFRWFNHNPSYLKLNYRFVNLHWSKSVKVKFLQFNLDFIKIAVTINVFIFY